jgi:phage gp46-like protein
VNNLKLVWNPDAGSADLEKSGTVFATGDGLETALVLAIFCDRRADPDDPLPPGITDRRGWWARPNGIGSKLWLLKRAKVTTDTVRRAKEYLEEATARFVELGVVERVEVDTWRAGTNTLGINVALFKGTASWRYDYLWRSDI